MDDHDPAITSEKHKKKMMSAHSEETKAVTIREVDKELWGRFISLTKAWGHSAGHSFSILIKHYQRELPFFRGPRSFMKFFQKASIQLETVENIEKLTINKEDLTAAGENIRYIFKNIGELIFDNEINSQDLLNHVHVIRNCQVSLPQNISSLILYSLVRSPTKYQVSNSNLKDIYIRNVSVSAYDEFVAACQLNNQKIGDAINEILAKLIPRIEIHEILTHELVADPLDILVITSINELNVSSKDLADIRDRKVFFHRVGTLKFDPDIEKSLFIKTVIGIYNCENVTLPSSVPKLIELSRVKKYL
ncbi:MAG: hypothetical protein ACFFCZ_09295 [Promethearchaeota archaeon]